MGGSLVADRTPRGFGHVVYPLVVELLTLLTCDDLLATTGKSFPFILDFAQRVPGAKRVDAVPIDLPDIPPFQGVDAQSRDEFMGFPHRVLCRLRQLQ
jgi:hypothetical protein